MTDGPTEPAWRPLIVDAERVGQLRAAITEVVEATAAWRAAHPTDGTEDADYATLRSYLAADELVPDPDDAAGEALGKAVAGVAERAEPGLYGGAARILFAVGHLSAGEDADTACGMIERSLHAFLAAPNINYDLISGLAGLAVPVLQRIADGSPSPHSEPLALRILEQLEALAEARPVGLRWHTPPDLLPAWQRELAPEGYFNYGLAHGMPGIAAVLARYVASGIEVARARRLLDGVMAHMQDVALPERGSRFPGWLGASRPQGTARVAWCYGDLGVAVAAIAAASATGRDDWRQFGLELAHGMAERPLDKSQCIDTGLCHGTAGVGHLFNRLAQATGDADLAAAAARYLDQTLRLRNAEPVAGFPRGIPADGHVTWEPASDLLTGAAGVALAFHAAISPIEPAWDQLLLSDLSPGSSGPGAG
ncbi:MAG TPA: lanthionine synthetase LanC family protein [Kofleriaceae bacterium]